MSPLEDSVEQPRKRGRPKKQQIAHESIQEVPEQPAISEKATQAYTTLSDEHLAYTLEEEDISQFSSFLRHILKHDHMEIARIASELNVAENTIYRWMNGRSEPRPANLKKLLEVLPEHVSSLTYVINHTFPGVLESLSTGLREVQKDIYRRVMELFTTIMDDDARQWQITQAIFEYALQHLDSDRRGLVITFAKLMPAREDGIHSLVETTLRGNDPWPYALENHTYLGSTTMAGTAAILDRFQTWDNFKASERSQVEIDEFERSACAFPVTRGGRIAGVLIVSSTERGFFNNPIACQAVIEYAKLLSLAFPEKDFYPFSLLNLRPMPDLKWQRAEISQSYVQRIMTYARKMGISRQEAEAYVRRDMEAEFEEIGQIQLQQQLSIDENIKQ
ncbi:MAG: helix-turn-helix transcriptional regulator [Chloroflexi bacterium]|nr:MAG: helix-turn-helix transcriptional regulator [Chloroflexota bacterium]